MTQQKIKAKRIAKKPAECIKKWGNARLLNALDGHVMCCATFDFDDQLERYTELLEELKRRLA